MHFLLNTFRKIAQKMPKYVGCLLLVYISWYQITVHFWYINKYIYGKKETYFQYTFILCVLMLQYFVLERMKHCHIEIKIKLFKFCNKNSNINNGRYIFMFLAKPFFNLHKSNCDCMCLFRDASESAANCFWERFVLVYSSDIPWR